MLRVIKPKNARSKRALLAREPQEVEPAKVCVFVKGSSTGERINGVLKDLMTMKRPHAISFAKKNTVHPFESTESFEFWSNKNDAPLFLVGSHSKKRPHDLVLIRMFDGRVLDMCEVGVENYTAMGDFKTSKSTPGHKPLIHFAGDIFNTHERYIQLKSLFLDLFNGEVIEAICLSGIEHVISVTAGPISSDFSSESEENLPTVHIRAYNIRLLASGVRTPRAELEPMGPFLDLSLRRHQQADPEMLKQATKRKKMEKKDVEKGLGKKRKNVEINATGDTMARIHMGRQDLGKLQTRKMKGLKRDGPRVKRQKVDESEGDSE